MYVPIKKITKTFFDQRQITDVLPYVQPYRSLSTLSLSLEAFELNSIKSQVFPEERLEMLHVCVIW